MKAIVLAVLGFIGGVAASAITDLTTVGTVFLGFVGGLAAVVIGDLASEEIRARLDRLPDALLCLAIRRLPPELRAERGAEWRAELDHILHRAKIYPVTRLMKGIYFAVGLLCTAPAIARSLGVLGRSEPAPKRLHSAWYVTILVPLGAGNMILNVTALQIIGVSKIVLWELPLALTIALLWVAHVAGTEIREAEEHANDHGERRRRWWVLPGAASAMLILVVTIGYIRANLVEAHGMNGELLAVFSLQLILLAAAVAAAYYRRPSEQSTTG